MSFPVPSDIPSMRGFDLLMEICREVSLNDAGRLWVPTDKLNALLFRLSGGDVRRLSGDVDELLALGFLEYRMSPHPLGVDWCYVNITHCDPPAKRHRGEAQP